MAQARPDRRVRAPARGGGIVEDGEAEQLDEAAIKRVDEAVAFADESPFPPPESLYDDVYVLGDQVRGWYSVDERSAGVHRGEDERDAAREAERGPTRRTTTRRSKQAAREDRGRRDAAPTTRRRTSD